MPPPLELTATVLREAHRFENPTNTTVVLTATMDGKTISLKGPHDELGPDVFGTYRFQGQWSEYKGKKQFAYKTCVPVTPKGEEAVVAYLKRAPGVGLGTAQKLWDAHGEDAIRHLEAASLDVLIEELNLSQLHRKRLKATKEFLATDRLLRDSLIELMGVLDGRGFTKTIYAEVIKKFGARSAYLICKNPYLLKQFHGCGFKRADALYCHLGLPPGRIKRQVHCLEDRLSNTSGDTWIPATSAEDVLRMAIGGVEPDAERTLKVGRKGKVLAVRRTDGWQGGLDWDGDCQWLTLASRAENESRLARKVREMMERPWPFAGMPVSISDHQTIQLVAARSKSIGILSGGPGTGKTYTAGKLIAHLMDGGFGLHIMACAPTGKAAVRLTESLAAAGASLRATTIHSMLGVDFSDDGQWGFAHNAMNPLKCDFLLVDESSMIDTDLMASLMSAVPDSCTVLFLGDMQQLLPVGHGAPFRDMIAAGVPSGHLTEVQRNAGQIVEACHRVRNEEPWDDLARGIGDKTSNLWKSPLKDAGDVVRALVRAAQEVDVPAIECQVVTPMKKPGSPFSTGALNLELQKHLNPRATQAGELCIGDKVINTKNGWLTSLGAADESAMDDSGRVYVANGEMGVVTKESPASLEIRLESPYRLVRVPRGKAGDELSPNKWELGYAITVHRSQGSEWPAVVVCVDERARRMLDRAWIYTSVSRARKLCVVAGDLRVAEEACGKNRIETRKTFLKELIQTREV